MTYLQVRQNKYGNINQNYNGHLYHSKKEAAYAQELDLRVKAKDIKEWERQIPLHLYVNGYKICTYVIDFRIIHNDDSVELVEVKGFETQVWRLKWRITEAIYSVEHPEITLTVVK